MSSSPLSLVPGEVTSIRIWGTPGGSVRETSVTGGTPPFDWIWNWGTGATPILSPHDPGAKFGLRAGTYSLRCTDASGATATHVYTVTQPPPVSIQLNELTPCTRNGGADGRAVISASGGIPPYVLSWSLYGNGATLRAPAGAYVGTALDSVGGSAATSVLITEPHIFRPDVRPPDCALMSDRACRDFFVRDADFGSVGLENTLGSALQLMSRGDEGVYLPMAQWTGVEATYESTFGRVSAWCQGKSEEMVEAMRVEFDRVTLFGGLQVTGGVTRFDVARVNVESPNLVLSSSASAMDELDGAGIVCGAGEGAASILYDNAQTRWNVTGNLHMVDGSLSFGGPTTMGAERFEATNQASTCGITMDSQGLIINMGALKDRLPVGDYSVTDEGLVHEPGHDIVSAENGEWHFSGGVTADTIRTDQCTLTTGGLGVGDGGDGGVSLTRTGFQASAVRMDENGIDLGVGGVLSLGPGWRIRHDPEEDALVFESTAQNGDGSYTPQLTLD